VRKKLKKPLKQPPPINQEKAYQKDLRGVVTIIEEAVNRYLIPKLKWLANDFNMYKKKNIIDDAADDLEHIFSDMKLYISLKVNEKFIAKKNALAVNAYNVKKFHEQIQHVFGFDIFLNDAWLTSQLNLWTASNVALIKSLENQSLEQIYYQVQSGFVQGLTSESIAKNIKERLNVSDSRANLIGRDQVSKLNGQLNMERQKEIGVDGYIWNTAHDERVRDSHREKDGKTFKWNDPPADTGHPGQDINCRCVAIPNFWESDLIKYEY
jgi:SPP1 gp7 family putative phage head morphogenesis protein